MKIFVKSNENGEKIVEFSWKSPKITWKLMNWLTKLSKSWLNDFKLWKLSQRDKNRGKIDGCSENMLENVKFS